LFEIQTHPISLNPNKLRANRTIPLNRLALNPCGLSEIG
jgi:hypothetical protein